jgi:hypothetical protein
MECDYTYLNHIWLVSQKKSDHQGCDYEGGLLYLKAIINLYNIKGNINVTKLIN